MTHLFVVLMASTATIASLDVKEKANAAALCQKVVVHVTRNALVSAV